MAPHPLRVGIAGAGVLGRLLAWQLSRAGHAVTVFDPASGPLPPATGSLAKPAQAHAAGFSAAGMLSPLAELDNASLETAQLGWRSLALWREVAETLKAEGVSQPLFAQHGSLLLAHGSDRGAAQRVLARLEHARALADNMPAPEQLSHGALAELEPDVAPGLQAWLLPGEAQVMPREMLSALATHATGVWWCWGERVERVEAGVIHVENEGQQAFDLAIDVRGTGARDLPASTTKTPARPELAEGLAGLRPFGKLSTSQARPKRIWPGTGASMQTVRGVRGEVIWLHAPGVALQRPVRLLHPRHRVYVAPRPDDVFVVGASEIESEDRSPVSLRSAVELMAAAHSVLPALAEARIVHMESNLRPALPDNEPRIHHTPGLLRINGLFRHGWLLAPALVQDALLELGLPPAPLRGFPPPAPEGGRSLRPGQARSAAALEKTFASTASAAVPPAPLRGVPPPAPEGGRSLRPGQARSAAALEKTSASTASTAVPPAPLRGFPPLAPEGGRSLQPGQARSAAALEKTFASTASSAVPPAPLHGVPPPTPDGGSNLRPGKACSAAAPGTPRTPTASREVPPAPRSDTLKPC
jgi:glycine oxidase